MKIALVSVGHYGSTIPLAKHLANLGYCVDYYLCCDHRIGEIEGVSIHGKKMQFGTTLLGKSNIPELIDYFANPNVRVFIAATRSVLGKVFNYFLDLNHSLYQRFLVRRLIHENYDYINIVGRYNSDFIKNLLESIPNKNIVVSLHEVVNHSSPDYSNLSPLLQYLLKKGIHIIVHSQNSLDSILKYEKCKSQLVTYIPFGVFESYETILEDKPLVLPPKYILMAGYITPYKGLDVLYKAVDKIDLNGYKIVVAGSGRTSVVDKIETDERYVYISGYLSNSKFVYLIKNSSFLVCPYHTMSQSGIPQTAFVYNKPIVASDLQGFKEIIKNGYNGYLVKAGDVDDLARALSHFINNENELKLYEKNIKDFKEKSVLFSWENIARKYKELFASL